MIGTKNYLFINIVYIYVCIYIYIVYIYGCLTTLAHSVSGQPQFDAGQQLDVKLNLCSFSDRVWCMYILYEHNLGTAPRPGVAVSLSLVNRFTASPESSFVCRLPNSFDLLSWRRYDQNIAALN